MVANLASNVMEPSLKLVEFFSAKMGFCHFSFPFLPNFSMYQISDQRSMVPGYNFFAFPPSLSETKNKTSSFLEATIGAQSLALVLAILKLLTTYCELSGVQLRAYSQPIFWYSANVSPGTSCR